MTMKHCFAFLLLMFPLLVCCNQAPKEYTQDEVEYNESKNMFYEKESNSLITKSFNIVGDICDGHIVKKEITIGKDGNLLKMNILHDDILVGEYDYSSVPKYIVISVFKANPSNNMGFDYMELHEKNEKGETVYYKKLSTKEIFYETKLDSTGKVIKAYEWKDGTRVPSISDMIEVVGIETGFMLGSYYSAKPAVRIKFTNVSGRTLTKTEKVNYKFIKDDEIIDNGVRYIGTTVGWDNDFVITEIFREYEYSWRIPISGIKAIISFDDGTTIFDGPIAAREVFW